MMKTFTDYARSALLFVMLTGFGLITSAKAMAGDSGLYWSPSDRGIGLTVIRKNSTLFFNVFGYAHRDEGCGSIEPPLYSLADSYPCSTPQWFYGANDLTADGQSISGFLYMGVGLNQPDGVPDTYDPFVRVHGENLLVGAYKLERFNKGWLLAVVRVGYVLNANDPIYGVTLFPQMIIGVQEPEAEPK